MNINIDSTIKHFKLKIPNPFCLLYTYVVKHLNFDGIIKTKLVKRECDNKCFLYTSIKDWNALPNSVTLECNFNKFFNGVKKFINSQLDS